MVSHTYKLPAYPKQISLRDGTQVMLRPMLPEDGDELFKLFRGLPSVDRYYLKESVTSPDTIKRWVTEIDYNKVFPLLAFVGDRVIADATLHRIRALAFLHVGELRFVVDAEFRNKGLGTALLHELATIADQNGLKKLLFQAVSGMEDPAIRMAKLYGFRTAGTLQNHAEDSDHRLRDVVLLEMALAEEFARWRELTEAPALAGVDV